MAADLAASGGAPAEISSATAASLRYPVVPAGLAMSRTATCSPDSQASAGPAS